jgi:hypothetical protein
MTPGAEGKGAHNEPRRGSLGNEAVLKCPEGRSRPSMGSTALAHLTAKDGGHANGLSGTILAMCVGFELTILSGVRPHNKPI